jgi:hypothetical protein
MAEKLMFYVLHYLIADEPTVYINSVQSIIDRLNQKVNPEKQEMREPEISPSRNFLDILKSIKKESEISFRMKNENRRSASIASSLDVSFNEEVCLQKSVESPSSPGKDETSMQELLRVVKLKHLFKCMARNGCAFSSDNAAKFRLHLEEVHATQEVATTSFIFSEMGGYT